MEYFVVYDKNDQVVLYLNDKFELHMFTKLEFKYINYRFKNSDFINVFVNNVPYKIFKFVD